MEPRSENTALSPLIRPLRTLPAGQASQPALVGARAVSYGELAERVCALACRLRDLGARRGTRIAIWMDKQPAYAEGILAALHASCVYVPLDGRQPQARIRTILADAEPLVLLTDRRHLAILSEQTLPSSVEAVVITDSDQASVSTLGAARVHVWGTLDAPASDRWAALSEPESPDIAALLYTSGSTGVPKGVRISHQNLASFVAWAREEFDVGVSDVFANHASFSFDLSTFDLFVALSVGAAVWIIGDEEARDVAALAAGLREHHVTVWYSVPSILHLLTASGALTSATTASLRYVLFAGELFPPQQLRALTERLPSHTALYNLYGPTETNVCAHHRVRPEDLARDVPVPIGGPISGVRLSVVDEEGREVEGPDAFGELIVEGDCVTPGYWGGDSEPAAVLHRQGRHATGDVVARENGLLVYRGRRDRMVKLAGYRVELGEVEHTALRHAALAEAAVVVEGEGTTARLVLFYTLRAGARKPNLLEIKRHCARHLPAYMLPEAATCLAALPRNANGKTDYQQLGDMGIEARGVQRWP
ncbi:amino acid adenylation domain-containing protein [Streptomyces sp. TRM 70351]|uniref:amino acid adenylation domain-containing protein n=1 Tax=Streptomyces sp. TRM 70351 TaxID=3116552 RepID=UPI002E7BFBCA|nr:amino acid adenylation domain-containing protein [Streptomyces sp. TRM 70351]MEE1928876.1 amino acid adenylation domain-containing protein [Streptomyces sp. TRM 70351]